MLRAYVLIEVAANQASWMDEHDGRSGFGMCQGRYQRLWPNEVILHLDCQDQEVLYQVIAHDRAQLDGGMRVTTCMVMQRERHSSSSISSTTDGGHCSAAAAW